MKSQTSLKYEFSWLLMGNLFYAAMQYLMLIGMVKLTTPVLVGQFSFGLAVNAPIALFMSMAIRAVVVSDSQNRFSIQTYLKLRGLTAICTFIGGLLFVFISHQSGMIAEVIILIALIKALESVSDIIYGFMQKTAQTHQVAKSLILRGTLSCFFAYLFLFWSQSVVWLCVGWLLATLLALIIYDLPNIRTVEKYADQRVTIAVQSKSMASLFMLALPLGIATVLSSLESNVPRYFIEGAIGLSSLGIFSALSYPLMLTNQIVGSLASAPAPKLAQLFHQHDYLAFRKLLRHLVHISLGVSLASSLVCILFGKTILTILNGPAYAAENQSFIVLSLAMGCNSVAIFFGSALNAMQCFYTKLILQVVSLVAVLTASAIASLQKTLFAMAIALGVGALTSLCTQIIAFEIEYRRRLRNQESPKKSFKESSDALN